jgi:hypothetical protein
MKFLNSADLRGTPIANKAALGTNTTQLATTSFVMTELASLETAIDGGMFGETNDETNIDGGTF